MRSGQTLRLLPVCYLGLESLQQSAGKLTGFVIRVAGGNRLKVVTIEFRVAIRAFAVIRRAASSP